MDVVLNRHTEGETRWGLRLTSWALLIQFVAALWSVAFAVVVRFILLRPPNSGAFSFYFALFSLPAQLLSAAAVILFLVGFSALYRHRGESGTVVYGNLRRSFVLLVAVIAAYLAGWAVLFFSFFFFTGVFELGEFQTLQAARAVASSGIGVVAALLLASLLFYVVISFAPASLLSRLKIAVVLMVSGAIVTFAISIIALWTTFPQEFNEVFVAPAALAVLLFWSVYRASQRSPKLVPGDSGRAEGA